MVVDDKKKSREQLLTEIQELRLRLARLEKQSAAVSGNEDNDIQDVCNEAVQRLRENEEKYRQIVDNSLEGIFIAREQRLLFCNRRLAEMFGFKTPKEAVGTELRKLVSPGSWERVHQELKAREEGKKDVSHYTFAARRIDGSEFEVESLSSRIQYRGNFAIQGVMRDVSRQQQLERQLRQAQKMEAIGTLAGGIAHDFNNILSVIIGYSELSLDVSSLDEKIHHNLEQVLKASHRAKDLVQQILSFSRKQEGETKPIQVNPIVREVLKLIRASLPATIEITQDISDQNYVLLADPTQVHQVLMNLCTNAAQAMQSNGGGKLEIELSDLNRDLESISEFSPSPSPYMRLTVRDSGHGMSTEVMDRIFDPFFTTKGVGEGTGLGLSVVHGIIKSLDGEITLESEPGKGTAFHLFLPIFDKDLDENEEKNLKSSIPKGYERILLVDDEIAVVKMVTALLERLGYEVVSCTNGKKALEIFRTEPHHFDLVITDNTMPQITGVQLALELMKIRPNIPIILCTGFSRGINPDDVKDLGIRELVMKPFGKEEIATLIRKVLDGEKKSK